MYELIAHPNGTFYVQERVSATLSRIVKSGLTYKAASKLIAQLRARA